MGNINAEATGITEAMLRMLLPHSHHAIASLAGVRGYCINVEQERRARGAFGPAPKFAAGKKFLLL